jgi:hypothetical protein
MVKSFYLLSFFPQPARRTAQPVILFRHSGLAAVIALVFIT